MRHGVAVERDEWKGDDFHRPLTPQGRDKTRAAARGLASFCDSPDLIATSPKLRALQTAEIVLTVWHSKPTLEIWPELSEGNLPLWMVRLRATGEATVLLVGHEPDLSRFASLLLVGDEDRLPIECKKAGALCIDLYAPGQSSQLLWVLPPRVLRKLEP